MKRHTQTLVLRYVDIYAGVAILTQFSVVGQPGPGRRIASAPSVGRGDGGGPDHRDSHSVERAYGLGQGGPGGDHVVDNDHDVTGSGTQPPSHAQGAGQVLRTLAGIQAGLVANARPLPKPRANHS